MSRAARMFVVREQVALIGAGGVGLGITGALRAAYERDRAAVRQGIRVQRAGRFADVGEAIRLGAFKYLLGQGQDIDRDDAIPRARRPV